MPKFALLAMMALAAALVPATPLPAMAENAPAAASAADAAYESQKAVFDAMPEADRRAIQDALIWSGHYVGIVDGTFGKRTRDAIVAWQASIKAPATGLVDAAQLAAMTGAAQKARAAVRFQVFVDDKTGVKIGAPLKFLDKRAANAGGGVRLMKGDGSITLDLSSLPGGDLAKLYAPLIADAPGKKITVKISRPDFIVVSGEDQGRKFYERMAKAPASAADPTLVRGFRLTYPAAQAAELDRINVAVASSFEPFPETAAAPAPAAAAAMAGAASAMTAAPAPAAAAPPPPGPAPGKPFLAATGLVVAPGEALSALSAGDCPNPTIDGKPVKFEREDKAHGLSLIAGAFGAAPAGAPDFAALGPDLVALTFSSEQPAGRVVLDVTGASLMPPRQGETAAYLLASLAKSARGGPVFDRQGRLAAVIAPDEGEAKLVAGLAPIAPHRAIDAEAIKGFLSLTGDAAAKAESAPLGAGQVAAAERANVVAIFCRR